jgi:hypothetical protein
MTKKLPLLLLLCNFALHAQEPIFSATSNISSFGSVSSPAAETFPKIIDGNINTKFLDFNYSDGLGFTVNLNGVQKTAVRMDFSTANDSAERDPMNYQISGSANGTSYTVIASGAIVCNPARLNTTSYTFSNNTAYTYYRLVFTNQCNTIESMIQIAEIQLFHSTLDSEEFVRNTDFTLYPNPTNGNFSIRSKSTKSIDLVSVMDTFGKQIKQVNVNAASTAELSMEGVPAGVYFVQITSGTESVVKKIIVQ